MKQLTILLLSILPKLLFGQYHELDSLDAFIAKQVTDYRMPGLAIGIIKNNKVIFKKGYGITSTTDSFPVTSRTIFPILSCTKAFTSAAIGTLVDEGKLQWNDKVVKYLPNFKLSDLWITKELTISDILSHRSGLESFEGDMLWYGTNYSRQEIVRRIQYSPVRNSFRVDFGYQNVMYLVAGLIIEKITGQTWDSFIKERIFTPLAMRHSSTSIIEMQKDKNYAHPHLKNKPIELINMDNIGPAGSINSTIDDLINWVQMWIGQGRLNGKIILNENSFETITSLKTMTSNSSDKGYGFGWNIAFKNGKKIIHHDGGMPGYKSSIVIDIESGTGIIILTNKISYLSDQLTGIITKYFQADKINWEEADKEMYGKNRQFPWDKERENISELNPVIPNFAFYMGTYTDKAYGNAIIKEINGKAILELLPSKQQFTGNLYYSDKYRFKIIFKDAFIPPGEIIFEYDTDKKVKGFKMDIPNGDFHFKYLNFKKNITRGKK